jgi:flagellar biosynthesis/type III secretory pathway chaperone
MIESIKQLVSSLREELQQYGEMLARLDDQQELVMRRDAPAVLQSVPTVQEQVATLGKARECRSLAMKKLCAELDLPVDSTFEELLPRCPENHRILVAALVQENNELLQRVQQRARQNHLLLARTVESMQRVINSLTNQRATPVYNERGSMFMPSPAAPAILEAVG